MYFFHASGQEIVVLCKSEHAAEVQHVFEKLDNRLLVSKLGSRAVLIRKIYQDGFECFKIVKQVVVFKEIYHDNDLQTHL